MAGRRSRRLSHFLSTALVASLLVAAPLSAQDSRTRAREFFEAGVAAFARADYQAALEAFERAYRTQPHPAVLVNIANCHLNLERPMDAAVYFERYLREAGTVEPARRAEIEAALGRARAAIATIDVRGPAGIEVVVDGEPSGRTPLRRPVEVNPGSHVVELRFPDGRVQTERPRLGLGQALTIEARASAEPVASSIPSRPPAPEPAGPTTGPQTRTAPESTVPARGPGPVDRPNEVESTDAPRPSTASAPQAASSPDEEATRGEGPPLGIPWVSWIAGGVAIVALGAGVGFGATALSQKSEYETLAEDYRAAVAAGDASLADYYREQARRVDEARATNALLADLFFVAAAAGAAVAVWFVVDEPEEQDGRAAAVRPTAVWVGPREAGIAWHGWF
ncbi:MAG: hypothetical protein NZ898_12085 [Myxococcota bacterium]|nr:hypothetical protein [Myxococcota bacterium]